MNEAVYRPDGSRIVYMRPPLMHVVDELEERHKAVQTVSARLNVVLRDTEKNKEWNLNGAYMGDNQGNMRLRVTGTGGILVLDMGMQGGDVDINLARKSRFLHGPRQELLNSQSEFSLVAHVGLCRDLFFPHAWSPGALERRVTIANGRELVSVIEKPSFIKKRSRRLTLSPDAPAVEQVEIYDRFGRDVGVVRYENYESPELGAADEHAEGVGLVYPRRIILQPHNSGHVLVLNVTEIKINQPLDPARLAVPKPDDAKKIFDLGQVLKRSGNLWD